MTLRDSVMQSCQPVITRRVDRTLPFFQKSLDDGDGANCCGAVERQLATDVFDAGAAFVGE